jgi:hypothetical protein
VTAPYTPSGSLAPLFPGATAGGGPSAAQGWLTAFNTTSMANTVEIRGGQQLTNLAILASVVPEITVPCSVLLIPFGSTYVIAGRLRVPA